MGLFSANFAWKYNVRICKFGRSIQYIFTPSVRLVLFRWSEPCKRDVSGGCFCVNGGTLLSTPAFKWIPNNKPYAILFRRSWSWKQWKCHLLALHIPFLNLYKEETKLLQAKFVCSNAKFKIVIEVEVMKRNSLERKPAKFIIYAYAFTRSETV